MAETAAFSELFRIPIEGELEQWRTLGDGALLVTGGNQKNERVATLFAIFAAKLLRCRASCNKSRDSVLRL